MTEPDRLSRWPELLIVSPVLALVLAAAAFVVAGQWWRAAAAGVGVLVAFFLAGIALDRYYRARPGAVRAVGGDAAFGRDRTDEGESAAHEAPAGDDDAADDPAGGTAGSK